MGPLSPHAAGGDRPGAVVDALVTTLTSHLGHEERDALPLIWKPRFARSRRW
jgi:hypothetical protein